MDDELDSLRAVPLFAQLDQTRLQRLVQRSLRRTLTAGAVLAVRGQPADHLIVVETGALSAVHETANGRTPRLGEFTAPCAIDKTAVLDNAGHTATWIAASKSRVRLIRRSDLLDLIDDVPVVRQHVLIHLATQVRDQQRNLVNASFRDTTSRVAAWLVDAASRGGARVILPCAQAGLGETIGASRVSVNRALSVLAREGLIRTEPGAVTVLAPHRPGALAVEGEGAVFKAVEDAG